MATYNNSSLIILGLLLIATASPVANSLDIISVVQVNVEGTLHCSLPPVPSGSPTLSGVSVFLSCDNGLTTMAKATTEVDGSFKIVYTPLTVFLFDQLKCAIFVKTPIASCNVFAGALIKATLVSVNLLDSIANYNSGDFQNIL
ncbi:hypothetical protein CsatA_025546 [Cannabis sativa]|uniref:Phylloplanin n=1 Tax=Cannabis sativa TaxID=3483 RepID=A0A803Q100_CANSA